MIEQLSPTIARTIVGDDYSSDYRYEMETTEEGLRLIITNKETGESTSRLLEDTNQTPTRVDPLYDDDRLTSMRNYRMQSFKGMLLAALLWGAVILTIISVVLFIK